MIMRCFVAVLPLLSVCLPAQGKNYLETDLNKWTVSANPQKVTVVRTSTLITFRERQSITGTTPIAASTKFSVPSDGTYLLWPDCESFVFGSAEPSTWKIDNVASATWKQLDFPMRAVPQWIVKLQGSRKYTLTISTKITQGGGGARLYPARLIKVTTPTLLPQLCYRDASSLWGAWCEFKIRPAVSHKAPGFLVFADSGLRSTPIKLPFGSLELVNPLPVLSLTKTTWKPGNIHEAWGAYGLVTSRAGTYWQVLEFDLNNPGKTLRLGSATLTWHRRGG